MLARFSRLAILILLCGALPACNSATPPPSNATSIDPNNELPFGVIDAPTPGMHVPRTFIATGWALDDGGVANIRLFVDNKYFMQIDHRNVRDDLRATFPTYTDKS